MNEPITPEAEQSWISILDENAQEGSIQTIPRNQLAKNSFAHITHSGQRHFLQALTRTGIMTDSCALAGIGARMPYYWRDNDAKFCAALELAIAMHDDSLESELYGRVKAGVPKGIYYRGEKVAEERLYSDNLLMFSLKGAKPRKYAERTELTGAGGGPIQVESLRDACATKDTLMAQLAAELNKYQAKLMSGPPKALDVTATESVKSDSDDSESTECPRMDDREPASLSTPHGPVVQHGAADERSEGTRDRTAATPASIVPYP